MSQGPKFFDNQIVQPSQWDFWRNSNEKNTKDNLLLLTDGYPGVVFGWDVVGSGSSITFSPGLGYDGNGERLETYSGISFIPNSGTNVVYARLALSDYDQQLGSGSTVTAVNVVTGLNLPVETYNAVEFTNVSGAQYIPIGCVEYSGGTVQSYSFAPGCRNHLEMFDGSIDLYDGTINLNNVASGSIPCTALVSPFTCNLIMNSGASILFNQSGTSTIGSPSNPAASISAVEGNFHALSGLSPIEIRSGLIQKSVGSWEADSNSGAKLRLDTLGRGTTVGGTLFLNNINNLNPSPITINAANGLVVNAASPFQLGSNNDGLITMPNTLTARFGSLSAFIPQSGGLKFQLTSSSLNSWLTGNFYSGTNISGTANTQNLNVSNGFSAPKHTFENKVVNSAFQNANPTSPYYPQAWNFSQSGVSYYNQLTGRPYPGTGNYNAGNEWAVTNGLSSFLFISASGMQNSYPASGVNGTYVFSVPVSDVRPNTDYTLKVRSRVAKVTGPTATYSLYAGLSPSGYDLTYAQPLYLNSGGPNATEDKVLYFNTSSIPFSLTSGTAYLNFGANATDPDTKFDLTLTNVQLVEGSGVVSVNNTYAGSFSLTQTASINGTHGTTLVPGLTMDIYSKGQFAMVNFDISAQQSTGINNNNGHFDLLIDGVAVNSKYAQFWINLGGGPFASNTAFSMSKSLYLTPGKHTITCQSTFPSLAGGSVDGGYLNVLLN